MPGLTLSPALTLITPVSILPALGQIIEPAVDALVAALLVARVAADLPAHPLLELVRVVGCQPLGAGEVLRHADRLELDARIALAHPVLDHADGDMGDVDPDPLPAQFLRRIDRRPAAAEGVEHDVARVGRSSDDPFEQGAGFLGGIAEAFLGA